MDLVVLIVWKENVPNLLPLCLGRSAADPFARQQLDRGSSVHARLGIVVQNVAHHLLRQALVIAKLFAGVEIAVASVANERGRVISFVLFDNVLPARKVSASFDRHMSCVCERIIE
jgi:hypothetical protein